MTTKDPRIGQRVGGRFKLERPLGSGGAGMVYEALQEDLGRNVAVKLLRPELAADPEVLERFRREARSAAALGHPHIAQVLDFAEPRDGQPAFIVFELVHGESLHELLAREEVLEPARAVTIATQVLAGLEAAHRAGIVHRDLKPANIFIADLPGVGESAKILDFGIAQVLEGEAYRRLTATGVIIGTPRYMSPEQVSGRTLDARSDLWSMGILLYRMLTGRFPFDGKTGEVIGAIRTQATPPMPRDAEVPPALEDVVARALKKDPSDRWESAAAMAKALRQASQGLGAPENTRRMAAPVARSTTDRRLTRSEPGNRDTLEDLPPEGAAVSLPGTRPPGSGGSLRPIPSLWPDTTQSPVARMRLAPIAFLLVAGIGALALALALYSWLAQSGPDRPVTTANENPRAAPLPPSTPVPPTSTVAPPELAPARGTLESFVARAAGLVGPEGTIFAAEVIAFGVDRESGVMDFEAVPPASLEVVLRSSEGRCTHYALGGARTDELVPLEACGPAIPPPFPEPVDVIEAGLGVCPAFAAASAPLRLRIWAEGRTSRIEVSTGAAGVGFVATSDGWGAVHVRHRDCHGAAAETHRPSVEDLRVPPALREVPSPPRSNDPATDGLNDPWGI